MLLTAILLTQFVIAQHIGLRTLRSLHEVAGVGTTIICTLLIAATLDWILLRTVLQPFDIAYLRLFISVLLAAAITPLIEIMLRSRYPQWFPAAGNLLPLSMTTCCTLMAAQISHTPAASFWQTVVDASSLSTGAVVLLAALQALRERRIEKHLQTYGRVVVDALNAAFILIALCGVLSIWQ